MTRHEPAAVDLEKLLDESRFSLRHAQIILLLLVTMLVDGYDIFVVGLILPAISQDWGLKPADFAGVFLAQQFGILIGAFFFGPFADRFGRKRTLLTCLVCFALCTCIVPFTTTPHELAITRFVSALFFAGIIPNCVAMTAEVAPKAYRATMTTIVFCGYTAGSFIGAAVMAFVVGPFGWKGAFYLGALLPLLIVPALWLWLPESVRYLAVRNPEDPRIARTLALLGAGAFPPGTSFRTEPASARKTSNPGSALFEGSLRRITLFIWGAYFAAFLTQQLIANWNSTVMTAGGLSMQQIAFLLSMNTAAGAAGTVVTGFLMDRFGSARVLTLGFLGAAASIGTLQQLDLSSMAALVCFTCAGFFLNSSLAGLSAQAALVYPSRVRSTGVAWGSGIGRIGGMASPLIGGAILAAAINPSSIYLVAALTQALAALAIYVATRTRPTSPVAAGAAERNRHTPIIEGPAGGNDVRA